MPLEDVIATDRLSQRRWRSPNYAAENRALISLGKHFTSAPQILFERLVNITLDLCEAGSAGLSLIEKDADGLELFKWVATGGAYAPFTGGTTPREMSPCGVCLARGVPQLYDRPERYFTQFAGVEPGIVEGLVVPIFVKGRPVGTIWIVSHSPERRFDREDVRIMENIAGFIAEAILRNESEKQLKEAEQFKRAILMSSPDCLKVLDSHGRIIFMNGNGYKLLGVKNPALVLNQVWVDLWDAEHRPLVRNAMAQARAGKTTKFQGPRPTLQGNEKWWDVTVTSLPGKGGQLLVVSRDITRQKRNEDEIKKTQSELLSHANNLENRVLQRTAELQELNDQLQRVSRKLLETEELERRQIAKELHDELGQKLTGLKLLLEGISAQGETCSKIKRAQEEVSSLMRQVRNLSFDLRKGLPDHLNLKTALDRHFDQLKQDQTLRVRFRCDDPLQTFPLETTVTVFRLVQEALTNVIRHSGVSKADVALGLQNDLIHLSITDRGVGFKPRKTGEGIGLRGMRERVLLCGGKLHVKTGPDAGTRVDVKIPLKLI